MRYEPTSPQGMVLKLCHDVVEACYNRGEEPGEELTEAIRAILIKFRLLEPN